MVYVKIAILENRVSLHEFTIKIAELLGEFKKTNRYTILNKKYVNLSI